MRTYMIGYDSDKTTQDYKELINKMKEIFPLCRRHLNTTWLVKSDLSPVQVRDIFTPLIASDDELRIASIDGEAEEFLAGKCCSY